MISLSVTSFTVAGICALRPNLSTVILGLAIGGLVVGIISYSSGEIHTGAEVTELERTAGIAGNANIFAYRQLFLMVAAFYFLGVKSSLWWRIALIATIMFAIIAVIASGSRSGFVGVLGFMIF